MDKIYMPLSFITMGKLAEIDRVVGTETICKRLMEMGFNKGVVVEIINNESGPMLIRVGESRLVLGRAMAQKVMAREV